MEPYIASTSDIAIVGFIFSIAAASSLTVADEYYRWKNRKKLNYHRETGAMLNEAVKTRSLNEDPRFKAY